MTNHKIETNLSADSAVPLSSMECFIILQQAAVCSGKALKPTVHYLLRTKQQEVSDWLEESGFKKKPHLQLVETKAVLKEEGLISDCNLTDTWAVICSKQIVV